MNTFSMNIAITISHAYVPICIYPSAISSAHDSAKFQVFMSFTLRFDR